MMTKCIASTDEYNDQQTCEFDNNTSLTQDSNFSDKFQYSPFNEETPTKKINSMKYTEGVTKDEKEDEINYNNNYNNQSKFSDICITFDKLDDNITSNNNNNNNTNHNNDNIISKITPLLSPTMIPNSHSEENQYNSIQHPIRASSSNTSLSSQQLANEDDEWIYIKMDGETFITTRSTLMIDKNSLLYCMFKPNSPYTFARDSTHPNKPYLFDRDPKYFRVLLNYLRTGELIFDRNINPKGVLIEAQFFNIQSAIEEIKLIVQEQESKRMETINSKNCDLTREFIVKSLITCSSGNNHLRFQGLNLQGLDLSGLDLSGINFSKSNLTNVIFFNANLEKANFCGCNLTKSNFTNACLTFSKLSKVIARDATFYNVDAQNADMCFSDFTNCDFRNTNFTCSNLSNSILSNADLSFANLKNAKLSKAILTNIKRNGANLSMGGVVSF